MNYTLKNLRLPAILFAMPLIAACGGGGGGGGGGDTGPVVPPPQTLTVVVSGVGTVASVPAGITNCSATGGTCTASFASGLSVQLTATPGASQSFRGWAGACSPSNTATCTILMDRTRQEVAVFESAVASGLGDTFALTGSGKLLSFDRATPGTVTLNTSITGLTAGDTPVALDFRPSNSLLYVLTKAADNKGRLYLVDEPTAAATLVSQISTDLAGSDFGMDFDPILDVLRVVSDTGQNLIVTPSSGVATATAIATRIITGVAFTNAFKGTQNTVSYVLDTVTDQLYTAVLTGATPTFTLVANLVDPSPVDVPAANGFDIDAINGAAYVAYNVSASSPVLRTINLSTGAVGTAASIGAANETIRGLAIPTPPEPQVFAICQSAVAQPPNITTPTQCTPGKTLVRFQASSPGTITVIGDVTGLAASETILAMDFRPSTGDLVALGSGNNSATSAGNIYTINPVTAAATLLTTLIPASGDDNPFVSLDTTQVYGLDFNPVVDRLRIVSRNAADTYNVNLRVDLATGQATTDGALQPTPFSVAAIAHDGSGESLFFYAIDTAGDRLYTMDNDQLLGAPGELTPVGSLGIDAINGGGFDITSAGTAYAALGNGSVSTLYTVNLTTGAAVVAAVDAGQTAVIGAASGFSGEVSGFAASIPVAPATQEFYAVSKGANPKLLSFNPTTPNVLTRNLTIAGLQVGEEVRGMEVRLSSNANVIYLLGSTSRLYTVSLSTALASAVGIIPFAPPLDGSAFDIEFDPAQANGNATNTIRIVSNTNQNLFVEPTSGAVTEDASLSRPAPAISAAAYTNSFSGATSTSLFVFNLNADQDQAMLQSPPNLGYLENTSATLGANSAATAPTGFDIAGGHNGLALFATTVGTGSTLYNINLDTGAGTSLGAVGRASPNGPPPGPESRIVVRALAIRLTQ